VIATENNEKNISSHVKTILFFMSSDCMYSGILKDDQIMRNTALPKYCSKNKEVEAWVSLKLSIVLLNIVPNESQTQPHA
jgi:hypothetical protein